MRVDDLQLVLERFPEVRELSGVPQINDRAARLLSGLEQLEVLQAEGVAVTETGLADLQRLRSLRLIRAGMTDTMQRELAQALPSCELRNASQDGDRRQEKSAESAR